MSSQSNIAPGPIAPENNPPINPEFYQPKRFEISAITLGEFTTVTTSTAHDFVIGQLVRFVIPPTYGTRGLNERSGYVVSLPSATQLVVNISSVGMNAFVSNPSYGPTPAQILPIGDIANGQINSQGRTNNSTYIPGSFINIS